MLVEAVRAGELPEARLDESVRRDHDAEVRARSVRESVRRRRARRRDGRQRRLPRCGTRRTASLARTAREQGRHPSAQGDGKNGALRVYLIGVDPAAALARRLDGRRATPRRPTSRSCVSSRRSRRCIRGYVFGAMQHEGDLAFHAGREGVRRARTRERARADDRHRVPRPAGDPHAGPRSRARAESGTSA